MSLSEVRKLLVSHNYTISVHKKANGCSVRLPNIKYGPKEFHKERVYTVRRKEKVGVEFYDIYDKPDKKVFVALPEYGIKPMIFSDIVHMCREFHYSFDCVIFKDRQGKELQCELDEYLPVLKSSTDEHFRDLEYKLLNLLLDAAMDGNTKKFLQTAEDLGVGDAFHVFHKLFNGESLA